MTRTKNKDYLNVDNLSFEYNNLGAKTKALRNVSFKAKKGEFLAIVGPSGCGKTTLLYCLGGLLKPTRGAVKIEERKNSKPGKNTAIVFQEPLLLPWRNVVKNISFGAHMKKTPKKEAEEKVKKFTHLVGLSGFENFFPHQLSGGMKQRVNLARALTTDTEILLLDEPFSHLDALTRESMQKELLNIYDKTNKTFIFVTHDINEAIYLADKVIVLSKRPGTVKKIIKIGLKRPRTASLKDTITFGQLRKKIRNLIGAKNLK